MRFFQIAPETANGFCTQTCLERSSSAFRVEGGTPTEIPAPHQNGDPILRISPDGNWIAYLYEEARPAQEQIAIIPAAGGTPVHLFPLPEDTNAFRWSPDGRGVQFVITRNGAANIWEQPVAGGPRRQITNFISKTTSTSTGHATASCSTSPKARRQRRDPHQQFPVSLGGE